MKRIFSLILVICTLGLLLIPSVSAATGDFKDVPDGKWYTEGVRYCASKGYVSGYSDGTFRPNRNVTRAEIAAVLSKMMNLTSRSSVVFKDVPDGKWYSDPISKCVSAGVMSGYGNGCFGPSDNVTREQAAVILSNAFHQGKESGYPSFSDAFSISDWAITSVNVMLSHNYMSGMGNNRYSPKSSLTRGQITTIIHAREKDVKSRASKGSEGWKQAFISYVNSGNDGGAWDSSTTFRLIDVDGDEIPELQRVGGVTAQGNSLVSYYHGRIERMDCYAPGISVEGKTGNMCTQELKGSRDRVEYRYYRFSKGQFTLLHIAQQIFPAASRNEQFLWDGNIVSESQFRSRQKSVFVFPNVPSSAMFGKAAIIQKIREY